MKPLQDSSDPIRMLHVDDDEYQLTMMRELLQNFDPEIKIDTVSNPVKALERFQDNWYDCIVVDYQMSEMTGIALARKIREESSVPIILYTGNGSEEVAEEAFSVGINDYVRKEVNPQHYQVLAKRIRAVVDKQRMDHIYTSVVKEARDSIIIIVGEKVVFANQAFVKLIGASSIEETLDKPLNGAINVDSKLILGDVTSLMRGEKTNIIAELEIKRKNGQRIPVETNLSIIDYLGEKAILIFLRDITERKTFETEIKKSEIRYRTLLELAPDGIITINLRGRVTWINPAYSSITGFTEEEIVGKKVWSIGTVRAPDVMMFLKLFYDLLRGISIRPVEFRWVRKDGVLGWGEGRASLIKIENKKTEVLLITRDITQRKEMEKNLKKYAYDMEQLAEERAQKLFESEKMVIAGAIASTVAHDLRGPLTTIRNAVYLMNTSPERISELKETIDNAVSNAVEMLNDIRKKTATGITKVEKVDIASFITSIIKETLVPSRITVKTDLKKVHVHIDRLKIRRVIENLIRNAMDAMPRKGRLYINNRVHDGRVVVEFKDNGIGIPDDVLKNLFEPFQTTKVAGTGLGLYYCRKTMEAHKGSIEIKSISGSGTRVILQFPIEQGRKLEEDTSPIFHPEEPHLQPH